MTAFRPTLIIRESGFPESGKFLPVKSGILGFGIRNTAVGVRNATNDWNQESKFHWQRLESGTWNSANYASLCKRADKMIIRLCKAWRVRRSFFPFVREARRSFPKKRTPARSYQYVKYFTKRAACRYGTGRCDVSSKFSCKNLSGVCCVWANQSHCKVNQAQMHQNPNNHCYWNGCKRSPSIPLREILEF